MNPDQFHPGGPDADLAIDLDRFRAAAADATSNLLFDADRLLGGVYRKHARSTRRRRALAAVPLVVVLGLGGATIPDAVGPLLTTAPALAAYEFSEVPDDEAPLVSFRGVELHYLPAGFPTEIVGEDSYPGPAGSGLVSHVAQWADAKGVGLSVTEGPGLTLDSYLEDHWFGDPVETTVGGRPALANGVQADEASGLLWSPRDGIVIEVHLGGDDAAELRRVVAHMTLRSPGEAR